jgi:GH15 family glucan-1,4-alpha-glucosidase
MGYQPIENYGIIGDLHTVALVGMDGSIDFLCFPNFDSPSVFAALLDDKKGGRFRIAPVGENVRRKQLYLPDTNVLLTRFLSPDGVAEITDFMPVSEEGFAHDLVRRVKVVRGEMRFAVVCEPRFDCGRADHTVKRHEGGVTFRSKGRDGTVIHLRSRTPLRVRRGAAHADLTLKGGEVADFILEEVEHSDGALAVGEEAVRRQLAETVNYWRRWIAGSTYTGRWREMVNRSALTLKLLFSRPNGSLVAAPTFGLPETIGGERNWDYRYVWIRDSAFTLHALTLLGFTAEATAYMSWLERVTAGTAECKGANGPLHVMYGIDGRTDLEEEVLHHFEGYRRSSPVRIGNEAYDQLQLDIYGELLDAVYLFDRRGAPIAYDLWTSLEHLAEWVADNWRQADEGIWEVRGGRKEFLYSRLMCWVALDRAIRIAWNRSFPASVDRWVRERDAIYRDIYHHFWDDERGAFVQCRGSREVDASSLLMPMVKFIAFGDARWRSHLDVVTEDLVWDSLVYRYRPGSRKLDGLEGKEGTFSMCSFWYVENLARVGRVDEARYYFEKMLGYANHLGLYSEELGPMGEHLGNFPQAFTHLGLISAALSLDQGLSAAGWEA